jgi:hypothetical protein
MALSPVSRNQLEWILCEFIDRKIFVNWWNDRNGNAYIFWAAVATRTFIFASADWMEIASILPANATATLPPQCK